MNVQHPNIQELIDREALTIKPVDTKPEDVDWKNYLQLDTINNWLEFIANKNDFITTVDLGQSFDGQTVKGVKFAKNETNPTIFIEAGIHAREWISPATTTFIINQLINSQSNFVSYFSKTRPRTTMTLFDRTRSSRHGE